MLDPRDFPEKLTISHMCELFGEQGTPLTRSTLWRWVRDGKIPPAAHHISKKIFWWDKANVLAHIGIVVPEAQIEIPEGYVSKENFDDLERRVKEMEAKFKRFAEAAA